MGWMTQYTSPISMMMVSLATWKVHKLSVQHLVHVQSSHDMLERAGAECSQTLPFQYALSAQ